MEIQAGEAMDEQEPGEEAGGEMPPFDGEEEEEERF